MSRMSRTKRGFDPGEEASMLYRTDAGRLASGIQRALKLLERNYVRCEILAAWESTRRLVHFHLVRSDRRRCRGLI